MIHVLIVAGVFVNFPEALDLCLRTSLPIMFLGLSLLNVSLAPTTEFVALDDDISDWRVNATEAPIDFTANDLLLGSQDTFFWFLVPLFGLISVGACVLVNYATTLLVHMLALLRSIIASRKGYIKHDDRRYVKELSSSLRLMLTNNIGQASHSPRSLRVDGPSTLSSYSFLYRP